MVIKTVLIASGIVGLLLAAFFLLAPEDAITFFQLGVPDLASRLVARNFGLALGIIGIVNVLASGDAGSNALRALLLGNLIIHIAAPLLDLSENFPREAGWWGAVGIHAVFVIAFGYCLVNWAKLTGNKASKAPQPLPRRHVTRGRA